MFCTSCAIKDVLWKRSEIIKFYIFAEICQNIYVGKIDILWHRYVGHPNKAPINKSSYHRYWKLAKKLIPVIINNKYATWIIEWINLILKNI